MASVTKKEIDTLVNSFLDRSLPRSRWPDVGPLWSILAALALVWVIGHWVVYQKGKAGYALVPVVSKGVGVALAWGDGMVWAVRLPVF